MLSPERAEHVAGRGGGRAFGAFSEVEYAGKSSLFVFEELEGEGV